jgi:multidrug efflux pump subunit AcrB
VIRPPIGQFGGAFGLKTVTTVLPGASPETMASAVATPLERQFSRIAGQQVSDGNSIAALLLTFSGHSNSRHNTFCSGA